MTNTDLKAIRLALGWIQARMAQEIGIRRESYNAMERGKIPISRRTALQVSRLAPALSPPEDDPDQPTASSLHPE